MPIYSGETLVARPIQPRDPNQAWVREGQHIRSRVDNNKVLDIMRE